MPLTDREAVDAVTARFGLCYCWDMADQEPLHDWKFCPYCGRRLEVRDVSDET